MIRTIDRHDAGAARAGVVVLVVLLVAAAVAVFLWVRYTMSPQYATLKAVQAMSDRDYAAFAQWVDVDAAARAAVRQEATARLGRPLPAPAEESAVAAAKVAVAARVRTGVPGVPAGIPFVALMFGTPVQVSSNDGSRASATVSAGGMSLQVTLRRDPDHWRVVEVPNATQVFGGTSSGAAPPRSAALATDTAGCYTAFSRPAEAVAVMSEWWNGRHASLRC